ncbi:MAG: hypothetical protein KAU48_09140 [Candidatus Thorarchaeota archaeon]|nr:hypothetical protein [Candidatus Thorarchaeota archaeon]
MDTEKENALEYIKTTFSHNQDLIQLADSKASIVIGVVSVLFPVTFGVEIFALLREEAVGLEIFMFVTFIILIILFALSFLFSIFTINPRIKENYDDSIFFQNIKKKTVEEYLDFINKIKPDFILKDYALETYALAEINCKKFKAFQYSILFLVSGMILLSIRYIIFFGILLSS